MVNQMRTQFYQLGIGYSTDPDGKLFYAWPFEISYAPLYRPGDFYLAEGDTRNGNGGFFPPILILEPQWRIHLEVTQSLWLIPLLEQIARGETVTPVEILHAYLTEKGHKAICEARTLY